MGKKRIDSQAVGLDVGLVFAKWLTGAENLHYGLWDGLEVNAANAGAAQVAYTDKLFELLPDRPCRILDIGGGAGETARKLCALGHQVEIVIPSEFLAQRCRENAPEAIVHHMKFEDFQSEAKFDICMFSESYQYIPLDQGLSKCLKLLAEDGEIILADCFRPEGFVVDKDKPKVGGGHRINLFRETLANLPIDVISEEDITQSAAPSVEIEQGFFNLIGHGLSRVDEELQAKKPGLRWVFHRVIAMLMNERKRRRLGQRLMESERNREMFSTYNIYLMMKLRPKG
ncbi:class I SAM-dependent methyltransferase [Aestuariibius sp. HNIBRBA575]|uniref:class I SAM-dependent methyltransferase n=1 Tax=Aestuariibius sp. HNIBRBA575 TaxID=3233343 RepID=UPI0034A28D79